MKHFALFVALVVAAVVAAPQKYREAANDEHKDTESVNIDSRDDCSVKGTPGCGKSCSDPNLQPWEVCKEDDPTLREDNDEALLPSIEKLNECSEDMCIKVSYSDGTEDLFKAKKSKKSETVLTGKLPSNGMKVVILLADKDDPEDTVVFKSDKTGGCTRFSVDLDNNGRTSCINDYPKNVDISDPLDLGPRPGDRSLEEIELSPRALDPNGYRLDVKVYYDDVFNAQFKEDPKTKIERLMAVVDEMYSESDTLKTKIDVNVVGIERAYGKNWGDSNDWGRLLPTPDPSVGSELISLAKYSSEEANLYVFLTGQPSSYVPGTSIKVGLGYAGVVCDQARDTRISISRWFEGSKGGEATTAETITHEMGHNLGMQHDFSDSLGTNYLRQSNGVSCKGYMDYNDKTNGWSPCSVSDFTNYINKQYNGFCLASLDGGSTGGGSTGGGSTGGGSCDDINNYCKYFTGDCSWDSWTKQNCQKSCGLC